MSRPGAASSSRGLVLAAMIFAVAMTFIDQTIVLDRGAADSGTGWA